MWQTLAVKVLEFVLMAVLERLIKNPKTPYDNVLKDAIKESYQGQEERPIMTPYDPFWWISLALRGMGKDLKKLEESRERARRKIAYVLESRA